MKTIEDVKELLEKETENCKSNGANLKVPNSKTKDLHQVIRYLELNPKEEKIREQLEKVEKDIAIIYDRMEDYIKDNKSVLIMQGYADQKQMERHYLNIYEMNHLKTQVEILKMILD